MQALGLESLDPHIFCSNMINLNTYQSEYYHTYFRSPPVFERKKYYLFCGSKYYPSGGWQDFKNSFCSVDEAIAFLNANVDIYERQWYQIVDIDNHLIIKEYLEG